MDGSLGGGQLGGFQLGQAPGAAGPLERGHRVTQLALEVLVVGGDPFNRVTQVALEIAETADAAVLLTQAALEVLHRTEVAPTVRLTQVALEVAASPQPNVRLTDLAVEIAQLASPLNKARLTQLILEVAALGNPNTRVTQVALEALKTQLATAHVTQIALEVLSQFSQLDFEGAFDGEIMIDASTISSVLFEGIFDSVVDFPESSLSAIVYSGELDSVIERNIPTATDYEGILDSSIFSPGPTPAIDYEGIFDSEAIIKVDAANESCLCGDGLPTAGSGGVGGHKRLMFNSHR